MATEYMVAQQYLTILSNLMASRENSKVVLLPAKTISTSWRIIVELYNYGCLFNKQSTS